MYIQIKTYAEALKGTFNTSKGIFLASRMRGSGEPIPELHHRRSPAPHFTKATPRKSPKHRYYHLLQ
jgi:hypothetical protein